MIAYPDVSALPERMREAIYYAIAEHMTWVQLGAKSFAWVCKESSQEMVKFWLGDDGDGFYFEAETEDSFWEESLRDSLDEETAIEDAQWRCINVLLR